MCRRTDIQTKILSNIDIVHTGFKLNNELSACHLWLGANSGNGRGGGYGRMCLSGHTTAVHIVNYTNHYGYVPNKKQIDHLCNNRLCCNPLHLEMVTAKQNQKRRVQRNAKISST